MGKKWQLITVTLALLLSFTLLFEESKTRSENNDTQLPKETLQIIEEELTGLDIRLNNYHIYGRNHQDGIPSYDKVMDYLNYWKQTNDRVEWTFQETKGREKWIGTYNDPTSSYTEKMTVFITPSNNGKQYSAYTIYEVSFLPIEKWHDSFSELFDSTSTLAHLNSDDVFLRVEGSVKGNDAANVDQWGNMIMDVFSADIVEGITEETFVSLSAHTDLWGQEIDSNGQKMNLQVALRAIQDGLGEETTVTIGTPLITTEY
ncbi:hypothetical protein J2S74_004672 [Evansella vedderi]|uniref:TATA-box binding n=1 Tax=Evansella vedderi TaxID=38282 RepID=A0ABU0A280_9BACI|nr:YwmB family TATA-box binding protein [Evansella vedderi]MDQ0257214.1 hypothetical protein [Evansella vedderi]